MRLDIAVFEEPICLGIFWRAFAKILTSTVDGVRVTRISLGGKNMVTESLPITIDVSLPHAG